MQNLTNKINSIPYSIKKLINQRLSEFESFKSKSNNEWFSELCFCILTANSRALTAINIQNQLKPTDFLSFSQNKLSIIIKDNKHRFHNNKAKYIVEARQHKNVKSILEGKSETEARTWIINNIKGLGYKEASHFLRNTGSQNLAILDRHIIHIMSEYQLIDKPHTLTPKLYLKIESKFNKLAKQLNISPAKLDLTLWYLKTGKVLK